MQTCIQCKNKFEFDAKDLVFFKKFQVPEPKRCHPCRRRTLLAWQNELILYSRKCNSSGKNILAMYPSSVPFPVYDNKEWWNEGWDPLKYGRDIDFSRPFFEQWKELDDAVPHYAKVVLEQTLVNSDYINFCSSAKNCYLIFDSDRNDECYYSYTIQDNKDIVDGLKVRESQLCYECIDCLKCYNCRYCQNVQNSNECFFDYNLTSCSNCFGCVNLKNAQYYWFNEKLTKEEYVKRLASIDLGSRSEIKKMLKRFEEHKTKFPKLFMHGVNNIDSTGDYLINSKNALECYDGFGLEDSKFAEATFLPIKDVYETFECGENSSLLYYSSNVGFGGYNVKFSWGVYEGCADVEYSMNCRSIKNCFGCSNLRKAQYCILNKQYTKEEYEKLRTRLIEHMKNTGEYGEFFPVETSPFEYNTSNAGILSSISRDEAIKLGFKWNDQSDREWAMAETEVPDNIKDVDENICGKLLADKKTGQNYKIIKQELVFYKKLGIPLPDQCFIERHKERLAKRNPKQLWDRKCDKCGKEIKTTWSPEKPEKIYCKECYLGEVA